MLGTRLVKTALCFICSKNLKFYGKGLQQRSYLLFKGQVYKNISRYYDKDFKITLLSQYWWFYCQIWKCWDLFWKLTPRINSQNLGSFQEKCQWGSFVIVNPLPLRLTVISLVSETYDFMELYYDLWRFTPDLVDPGFGRRVANASVLKKFRTLHKSRAVNSMVTIVFL